MSSDPQDNSASGGKEGVSQEASRSLPTTAEPDEGAVLERVLQQTMSDLENMSNLTNKASPPGADAASDAARWPDDLALLQDVARRFKGCSWGSEFSTQLPIAHALVEASLACRFNHLGGNPDLWKSISETISSSLLEDPHVRVRLQVLWAKLCESLT